MDSMGIELRARLLAGPDDYRVLDQALDELAEGPWFAQLSGLGLDAEYLSPEQRERLSSPAFEHIELREL